MGIGDQVAGPLSGRRGSGSAESEFRGDSAQGAVIPAAREATQYASWDFSKISIFPSDREGQVQGPSPFHAPGPPGVIQTKRAVNEPEDEYEHEAEHVAAQVMRMPAEDVSAETYARTGVQRQIHNGASGQESAKQVNAGPATAKTVEEGCKYGTGMGSASPAGIPPSVQTALRSPGQPLKGGTREFMEARFRQDFSKVRVHTSESAAGSARAVHALAYTVGDHIVFGAGQYAPGLPDGAHLLAHELTHVLQQRNGGTSAHASESVYEANANLAAVCVLGNSAMPPTIVPARITLAREPDQKERKLPTELIVKANAEIDRLRGIAKQKGDNLTPEDALRAYDAVHSVVMAATAGKDEGFLDQARDVKTMYDSIIRNTPADKPHPFTQHPAASPEPMSEEEGSKVVIAQRAFDADLNPQRIQEARDEIRKKQKRLAEIQDQLQLADDATKEKLAAEAKRLRKEVAAANSRIAMSRPTLNADPEKLQAQKQEIEREFAKPETTDAKRKKLQARMDVLDEQIRALTSGQDKVPLSALQGGKLGDADLSKSNKLRDQKAELEDKLQKATSDAEQRELQAKIGALDEQMTTLDRHAHLQSHQKTYVTVQILGPDGKTLGTFQARNDPEKDQHAEDLIFEQLRKMPDKSILKRATIVMKGDQEVCDRCAPRVREFAKDYPVEKVVGDTAHTTKLTSQGKDSGM